MNSGYFFDGSGNPLARPEDVIPLLAKAFHWREGRSAFEAANSWFEADDIPPAIRSVLATDVALAQATLVKAIFERQTKLDSLGRPSQTDVLAFLKIPSGLAVLGVEAKVDETFGPTVDDWRRENSAGQEQRLAGLIGRLEIDPSIVAPLRYQLLHRTVAALIEAETAGTRDVAVIVQSFSPRSQRAGFEDFQAFAKALGAPVGEPGVLSQRILRGGIRLRLGWAQDSTRAERHPG